MMIEERKTVYIVDDDDEFRESLEVLIRKLGFNAVAFSSAEDFLKLTSFDRPTVLLLDVFLPQLDGIALQKRMNKKDNTVPIIFITGHGDVPMSVDAMKKGAVNFLMKPVRSNVLKKAIEEALEKDVQFIEEEAEKEEIWSLIARLTPREYEVMRYIIRGKLNKQIAGILGIVEETIKIHRGRVMNKMKVKSVAELVAVLAKVGIVADSF